MKDPQVQARVKARLDRIFERVEAVKASIEYDRRRPPRQSKGDTKCPS